MASGVNVSAREAAVLMALDRLGGHSSSSNINSSVLREFKEPFDKLSKKSLPVTIGNVRKRLAKKGLMVSLPREKWKMTNDAAPVLADIRRNLDKYPIGVAKVVLDSQPPSPPAILAHSRQLRAGGHEIAEVSNSVNSPASGRVAPDAGNKVKTILERLRDELSPFVDDQESKLNATLVRALRLKQTTGYSREAPRNIIFCGPPGTGKTLLAKAVAKALTNEAPSVEGRVRLVQFHPSYGYEDFVWGIRPVLKPAAAVTGAQSTQTGGAQVEFEGRPGPFKRICDDARKDSAKWYVLIIDEINRGDPARIFGELLYALEYREESVLCAHGEELVVPSNLVVLGTMNSVDRSVALVDYALRRRFAFIRVDPQPELIAKKYPTPEWHAVADALRTLNDKITHEVDADHQIGHSYFLSKGTKLSSREDIDYVWQMDIKPQLEELFHGRGKFVKDLDDLWQKKIREGLAAEPDKPTNEGEP